ncbi:unnamed protein product [Durusdinium trenchii]|uniref:Uncharacterized protein n=1 Tax=Durusdinium trenchii TaxID=1381693 RepID=A0ABP0JXT8_9DINO
MKMRMFLALLGNTLWKLAMAKWWDLDQEFNYVESLALVTIVFLELLFDGAWHVLSRPASKSYYYGRLHEDAFDKAESGVVVQTVSHAQLYKELMNKMGGEFMSLGFIAFMIFCSNQLGFFDFIAERLPACGKSATPDCVMLPYTGIDWLHLIASWHLLLMQA